MISGLPTSLLNLAAPEIIQDGENGFHINPTNLEETALKILNFSISAIIIPNTAGYQANVTNTTGSYIPMICYCALKSKASGAMSTRKT